jgi:hypothetical protein
VCPYCMDDLKQLNNRHITKYLRCLRKVIFISMTQLRLFNASTPFIKMALLLTDIYDFKERICNVSTSNPGIAQPVRSDTERR